MTQGFINRAYQDLKARFGDRLRVDVPIARFTSFRLGGPAALLAECDDKDDLVEVSKAIVAHDLDVLILGKGTNMLVSDRGFPGLVVRLFRGFDFIREEPGQKLTGGGTTQLPRVANRAAKLGLSGLEFAIAIPATVGGAVRMNAGAHGSSVANVLFEAEIFNVKDGSLRRSSPGDLNMQYRHSSLEFIDIVCSATFQLLEEERGEISKRMEQYRAHRSETQPVDAPNAGSMFKNPTDISAGRLIEEAGLKGLRVGGAEVSKKHANFFLAHPGSASQDVYDLMARVQREVEERSGVVLIPEVRTVGEFDRAKELRRE